MNPISTVTKSKRKQLKAQQHSQYANIDLSYNQDLTINNVRISKLL